MQKGTLVITLDFELAWGLFDHINLEQYQVYFNNTRNAIPKMLTLFHNYNVKATWAVIGMLFNKNWEEWEANIPHNVPTYTNAQYNAYAFGQKLKKQGFESLFFAPNLIRLIKDEGQQEIATHTYSHYYCLENGQTAAQFQADLQQAAKIAGNWGIQLKSLVFPRNQFNSQYLHICATEGITSVRSNPSVWYWQPQNLKSNYAKIIRTADAYVPLGPKSYSPQKLNNAMPLQQPASRFMRPEIKLSFFNKMRFNRIKNEMITAAKNGEVYHLWWHPHNFGHMPSQALKTLEELLLVYKYCKETYGMESISMHQLHHKIIAT